jgi:hypothetical protein
MAAAEAPNGLVASEAHKGAAAARSHGVSIYFPRGDVSVAYDKDFAKATRRNAFFSAFGRA